MGAKVHPKLTRAEVEQYESTGFLHPIDALSADEADRYRLSYERVSALLGGSPKAVQLIQVQRYYDWAWELGHHPAVLDAVECVLGPDIILWSASVFPKRARDPGFVTMHQDGTYWGLEGGAVTTAWVALTDSRRENGCMRIVPGSQKSEILPHKDTYAADNLLTRGQVVEAECDEADIVDIELRQGQMSLHHVRAIHGSHSNGSDQPRIGFAARYVTPDVKPLNSGQSAVLVRGRDRFGHWDLHEEAPVFGSLESAVHAHQQEAGEFVAMLTRD